MGTCSALVYKDLLEMLDQRNDCKVVSYSDFGEDLYQIVLEHSSFEGYAGQYCIAVDTDGQLTFRRDLDV